MANINEHTEGTAMETVLTIISFPLLVVLWLAFGVAAVRNPTSPDNLWRLFRRLPLLIQLLAWLLLFPLILALWIWQASWPFVLRLPLVAGLAVVTIYLFLPGRQLPGNDLLPGGAVGEEVRSCTK
jgi:hypothetical protein